MNYILQIKHIVEVYWPTLIPIVGMVYNWITKDLALAISHVDKNNDGTLSNDELEDLAVELAKNSRNPTLKVIPEFVIRLLIRKLCAGRKFLLKL